MSESTAIDDAPPGAEDHPSGGVDTVTTTSEQKANTTMVIGFDSVSP